VVVHHPANGQLIFFLLLLFRLREKKKGFDILRIPVPGLVYCTQIGMLLLLTLNGWGTN
jgi:hypothetical protein